MTTYEECINKLMGKTPTGEIYVMKSFPGRKVTIELLQYQATFEPKITIHNGQISFAGAYCYDGKQCEIIIPGTNEAVKLYEHAMNV